MNQPHTSMWCGVCGAEEVGEGAVRGSILHFIYIKLLVTEPHIKPPLLKNLTNALERSINLHGVMTPMSHVNFKKCPYLMSLLYTIGI